jgi:uncharacterized protein YxjI
MKDIQFPVKFQFKIGTLSNSFTATDNNGQLIAYVKQKMFKLKEDISIFSDETQTTVNYRIKADKWLDFSAAYAIYDADGTEIGKITRKGWRSIWKARYEIIDQHQQKQYEVNEERGWVKVLDSILGQIPILSMFTGYLFNPSYMVTDTNFKSIVQIKKLPSFFGRDFELKKVGPMDNDDDDRIVLALMMMILLEKNRG